MTIQSLARLLIAATVVCTGVDLHAQGVSVDVSAGRLVYDPGAASVGSNNVMGTVRVDSVRQVWVYGSAAVPLGSSDTFWGSAGAGGRLEAPGPNVRRASVGADVGAHGFSFRDAVANQIGTGGTLEALPFIRLNAGLGFAEGRAGVRGYSSSFAGTRENRAVFETGARVGYGSIVSVVGDAYWVGAAEGTYPFVGATIVYNGAPVQLWGQTGKWLADSLSEPTWAGGLDVTVGGRSSVWATVRQDAPDPLYWNTTRRTWSVGVTRRLGRRPAAVIPARGALAGGVLVALRAADAPAGEVSIAGDFNNWQAAPMRREGNDWVIELEVPPGVYHYTFRSAAGEWFVPASTAGRRDDGFGGSVAVLVVN